MSSTEQHEEKQETHTEAPDGTEVTHTQTETHTQSDDNDSNSKDDDN